MKDLTLLPIKNNKTYYINTNGIVYNTNFNRTGKTQEIKPSLGGKYLGIMICIDNECKRYLIHRLKAQTYIPNPDNKETVNHDDGDTLNNDLDNLSWMTYSENHKHAYEVLGRVNANKGLLGDKHPNSIQVNQIDKDGNIVNTFGSLNEAQREGFNMACISMCLNGKRKTHKGFKWEKK